MEILAGPEFFISSDRSIKPIQATRQNPGDLGLQSDQPGADDNIQFARRHVPHWTRGVVLRLEQEVEHAFTKGILSKLYWIKSHKRFQQGFPPQNCTVTEFFKPPEPTVLVTKLPSLRLLSACRFTASESEDCKIAFCACCVAFARAFDPEANVGDESSGLTALENLLSHNVTWPVA